MMNLRPGLSKSTSSAGPRSYRASQLGIESDITEALRRWNGDDCEALAKLFPEVVDELRRLAQGCFSREDPGHTLQPTALINEVYLRLNGSKVGELKDRGQFFAFAARLMREILVDHARARKAAKRGGGQALLELEVALEEPVAHGPSPDELLQLDRALDRLGRLDARQRSVVELRYFVGLTLEEIAEVLNVSLATIERSWRVARRWLARELS